MLYRSSKVQSLFVACVFCYRVSCTKDLPIAEVEGVITSGGKPLSDFASSSCPTPTRETWGRFPSQPRTKKDALSSLVPTRTGLGAMVGWHKVLVTDLTVGITRNWTPAIETTTERLPPQNRAAAVANRWAGWPTRLAGNRSKSRQNEIHFEVNKKEITVARCK